MIITAPEKIVIFNKLGYYIIKNKAIKKFIICCLALLFVVQANAQSNAQKPFPAMEIHTRPISLLQGVITVGSEIRLRNHSSFLIDGGAGTSQLDNRSLTTFLVGGRLYLK